MRTNNMDLTKEIIDFTQKVEFGEIKRSEGKMMNANDFGMFNIEGNSDNIPHCITTPNEETVEVKMPTEKLQKPTTPQLIENAANVNNLKSMLGGDISPPPRPLTSSEVVGFTTTLEDPEMQLDPIEALNKSRSLPASPNHLKTSHIAELFAFGPGKSVSVPTKPTAVIADKKIPNVIKSHVEPLPRNNQQFCLRWNNYQTNLTNVFDELLQSESFVDVTLACEGQSVKAHKMILSACSPYFQALFYDNPCQHPIVIMRDVRWQELKALMEFMYKGEINVSQDQINPLLKVAEMLKIRGLAEVSTAGSSMAAQQLIPEQRMTVYDEEAEAEDEDDVNNSNDQNDGSGCPKAKRARIQVSQKVTSALDLNLTGPRLRKRSRDGLLIDDDHLAPTSLSRSESPQIREKDTASPSPPITMTASTIVRNPFASPNPNNQPLAPNPSATASTLSSSSSSASGTSVSSVSSPSAAISYRRRDRSSSPSLMPLHNSGTGIVSLASPTTNSASQISIHPHPASAAAAALANPHHPHHHAAAAAQQFAAQHQLHAAAQSHAAMASALGASLAAAAAGAGSTSSGPANSTGSSSHHDDMEIKPEIAEMIREEERAKMIESGHPWMGGASTSSVTDSYQYQLQSMWQKCWNTNQQNLVQQLRFRERGPLKSWRPEAMAEAIFSVLKEGLSLSQAARKYDIPYPTFVLYANRVHNMLGPSLDGGSDPRPKARGRPQRILLGMWPEDLIRSVIKAVVFRDYREIKDEMGGLPFANGQPHAAIFGTSPGGSAVSNGFHTAAKLAAQNAGIGQESASPLSSMTENLRRQIMSQQQQSPISQSMNMYKSPSYVQRTEIDDQISAVSSKQQADRRGSENLPDLSALGLIGLPGINVIPTTGSRNNPMHANTAAFSRERERERNRERERDRERERERERERDLKDVMQARQYSNQSRGSAAGDAQRAAGSASPYSQMKIKEHPNYAYNKRFLESLPPGIDFEAIANGLLQKTANKSPRFEDFFQGSDMNELISNAEAAPNPPFPSQRESNLMKIKLEHQPTEIQHED